MFVGYNYYLFYFNSNIYFVIDALPIIGITVAILFALGGTAAVVWYCMNYKRKTVEDKGGHLLLEEKDIKLHRKQQHKAKEGHKKELADLPFKGTTEEEQ